MSTWKKVMPKRVQLPNYSRYEYADVLPPFRELNRIGKNEITMLSCSNQYILKLSLNQLTDNILTDYLFMLYRKKGLETAALIRKLVVFFI